MLLLTVGAVALVVGVTGQLGWPAGAICGGVLALAGGIALGVGEEEEVEPLVADWLIALAEYAASDDPILDVDGVELPEKIAAMLDYLPRAHAA